MSYGNQETYGALPGDGPPIHPNLPRPEILQGLNQSMAVEGSLSYPPFLPYGNAHTISGSNFGNNFPMIQVPPFMPFPIADSSYNLNIDVGGSGGGGGGDDKTASVDTSGINWLNTSSSTSSAGGVETTTFTHTINSTNFCNAVTTCVDQNDYRAYRTFTTADGSASAATAEDTATLTGDWTTSVGSNGTAYIKTSVPSTDSMKVEFVRHLFEKVQANDSGGSQTTFTAGGLGSIIKVTGGDGITVQGATTDAGTGTNADVELTIAQDGSNAGVDLLLITSGSSTQSTFTDKDSTHPDIAYTKYSVSAITIVDDSGTLKYDVTATGNLYDFSKNKLNLPTPTGTNPSFSFQALAEDTLVLGRKLPAVTGLSGNNWVTSSLPSLDFACG